MGDEEILSDLGARVARVRLDQNLTQSGLAAEAGVHKNTVVRLEGGGSVQLKNLIRILRVLGLSNGVVDLVPAEEPSPLRRLEAAKERRQRASPRREERREEERWRWGDESAGDELDPSEDGGASS